MPALQRSFKRKTKILSASPLAELKTGTPDHADLAALLIQLEGKKVTKKIEVGADAEKDFVEMDEGRNVKDGVGI